MDRLAFNVEADHESTCNKECPLLNLRKCEPEDSQRDIFFNSLHFASKHQQILYQNQASTAMTNNLRDKGHHIGKKINR